MTFCTAVDTTHDTITTSRTHADGSRDYMYVCMYRLVPSLPGEAPASGCIDCQGDRTDQATYWLLAWLRTCALANFVSVDTAICICDVYAPHIFRTQQEQNSRVYFWVPYLPKRFSEAMLRQQGSHALRTLASFFDTLGELRLQPMSCACCYHQVIRYRGFPFFVALGGLLPQQIFLARSKIPLHTLAWASEPTYVPDRQPRIHLRAPTHLSKRWRGHLNPTYVDDHRPWIRLRTTVETLS